MDNRLKIQHLLWRAGFGPKHINSFQLKNSTVKETLNNIFFATQKPVKKFNVAKNLVAEYFSNESNLESINKKAKQNRGEINSIKMQMRQASKEDLKTLNNLWVNEMINSDDQLREKMSLFWHGHFACRLPAGYYQQELLNIIRQNALGNFGDLLIAVSKSPAMLSFLNNDKNRKKSPNENFAREVMELFTMGRGHYSETDVKEAARAFTGWSVNTLLEFDVREFLHDNGEKKFLGHTGNLSGDDVLNILLQQKQTAKFITEKIYRYFVNEKINDERIKFLSEKFYNSNYNISGLMMEIFSSEWFYDQENIGVKIKSPVELIAGIRRMMPLTPRSESAQIIFQKILGQVLFFPPNVAGWPGGTNWIDSSTLMARLQVPRVWAGKEILKLIPKGDDDVDMGKEERRKVNKGDVKRAGDSEIEWDKVYAIFEKVNREDLADAISSSFLQVPLSFSKDILNKYTDSQSRQNFISSSIIQIMSTPEYQVC